MNLADPQLISGLLCGIAFGFILENVGFANPCKLTAQFEFRDWSVFKVMFTAIIVAAAGLFAARVAGWISADQLFIPTTHFWGTLIGGALIGVGFSLGGYCPGTSVAAFASGRLDGLVFIVGLLIGTAGFAGAFDGLHDLLASGVGPEGQTLPALLGIPEPLVLALLVLAAIGGFALANRFERRGRGPVRADETAAPERVEALSSK
jgi:uncharacterized membrane protein YedE/YeeE